MLIKKTGFCIPRLNGAHLPLNSKTHSQIFSLSSGAKCAISSIVCGEISIKNVACEEGSEAIIARCLFRTAAAANLGWCQFRKSKTLGVCGFPYLCQSPSQSQKKSTST